MIQLMKFHIVTEISSTLKYYMYCFAMELSSFGIKEVSLITGLSLIVETLIQDIEDSHCLEVSLSVIHQVCH